jgi:hypothetical protein
MRLEIDQGGKRGKGRGSIQEVDIAESVEGAGVGARGDRGEGRGKDLGNEEVRMRRAVECELRGSD